MTGPVRTATVQPDRGVAPLQPPRPPNAWILYRSDKLKQLPPLEPGAPRRPQADISKQISTMWKNESEAVRNEYERRADLKKAEHQAMYPGYRFQPMKKVDRERLREQKKTEKERERLDVKRSRVRGAYTPGLPSGLPIPTPSFYMADTRFGPSGPSPPLSAASSPATDSPLSHRQSGAEGLRRSSLSQGMALHTSTSSQSLSNLGSEYLPSPSSTSSPSYSGSVSGSRPPHPGPPPTATQPNTPQFPPSPSSWQSSAENLSAPSRESEIVTPAWFDYNSGALSHNSSGTGDFVTLPLPSFGSQAPLGWTPDDGSSDMTLSDPMHAMISATGDPSIFQLTGFDPEMLLAEPSGEIEVSMAPQMQMPFPFDPQMQQQFSAFTDEFFSQWDFSTLQDPSVGDGDQQISPLDQEDNATFPNTSDAPNDLCDLSDDPIFQFLNLEGGPAFPPMPAYHHGVPPRPNPMYPPPLMPAVRPQDPVHAPPSPPYVPPTGASNASSRRVGASWKPPFSPVDSPMDQTGPPEPWGVSAS